MESNGTYSDYHFVCCFEFGDFAGHRDAEKEEEVMLYPCRICKHKCNYPCTGCAGADERLKKYKWELEDNVSSTDSAHHDTHYQTQIQPLEAMQANMTKEEFIGFLKGNIIKYACRCGRKEEAQKEAEKIQRYAEWLVAALKGEKIDPRK